MSDTWQIFMPSLDDSAGAKFGGFATFSCIPSLGINELGTKAPQIHELFCCLVKMQGLEKQGFSARKFYQFAIRHVTLVRETHVFFLI